MFIYCFYRHLLDFAQVGIFKVKTLKKEERQISMSKGPDKFLEDAFSAADKKYVTAAIYLINVNLDKSLF